MPEERILAVTEPIRARIRQNQFRLSKHATKRMDFQGITLIDIKHTILAVEIIMMKLSSSPSMTMIQRCTNQTTGHGGKSDEVCVLQGRRDSSPTGHGGATQPSGRAHCGDPQFPG